MSNKLIYVLKTQGTGKIPDCIQIRDEKFVLLLHSRADKIESLFGTVNLENQVELIMPVVNSLSYGEMTRIDL